MPKVEVKASVWQQFQQLLTHATARLGLSGPLLPMLHVSAATIGNGARLETDIFPTPVNPSLACAVIGSRGLEITEHLISPLREERDNCLLAMSRTRRKALQGQIRIWQREQQICFGKDLPRDPEDEAYYEAKIAGLENQLWAPLASENPTPKLLFKMLARGLGHGLQVLYSEPTLRCLLGAEEKSAAAVFEVLACGLEGKTPDASLFEELAGGLIVRPVVSTLLVCEQSTIVRLLLRSEPFIQHFSQHLLIASTGPDCAIDGPGPFTSEWRELIAHLAAQRRSGHQRRLLLSSGATKALLAPGLTRHARLVACKFALNLHLILEKYSGERTSEISQSIMTSSISEARQSVLATAEMKRLWLEQAEEQTMEAKAWRLLEKISRSEPVKPRTLWRKFHVQRKAIREPELDYLLRKGMVRLKDGLVEAIKPEGGE